MSLSVSYAKALYELSRSASESQVQVIWENLKKVLKQKGHERLLPRILQDYEKIVARMQVEDHGVLELGEKRDATRFKDEIRAACAKLGITESDLEVKENDKLIGGFLLRKKELQIDNSFRRKLLELYRQLIAA